MYSPCAIYEVIYLTNDNVLKIKDNKCSDTVVHINKAEFKQMIDFVYKNLPEFTEGVIDESS